MQISIIPAKILDVQDETFMAECLIGGAMGKREKRIFPIADLDEVIKIQSGTFFEIEILTKVLKTDGAKKTLERTFHYRQTDIHRTLFEKHQQNEVDFSDYRGTSFFPEITNQI